MRVVGVKHSVSDNGGKGARKVPEKSESTAVVLGASENVGKTSPWKIHPNPAARGDCRPRPSPAGPPCQTSGLQLLQGGGGPQRGKGSRPFVRDSTVQKTAGWGTWGTTLWHQRHAVCVARWSSAKSVRRRGPHGPHGPQGEGQHLQGPGLAQGGQGLCSAVSHVAELQVGGRRLSGGTPAPLTIAF